MAVKKKTIIKKEKVITNKIINNEVSVKDICTLYNMVPATVRSKIAGLEIVNKVGSSNYYNSLSVATTLFAPNESIGLKDHKVELVKAQTEKLTIENEIKKGELIKYDDVVGGLGDMLAIVKNSLMDFPAKFGKDLSFTETESDAIAVLQPAITAVLNTLAASLKSMTYKGDEESDE